MAEWWEEEEEVEAPPGAAPPVDVLTEKPEGPLAEQALAEVVETPAEDPWWMKQPPPPETGPRDLVDVLTDVWNQKDVINTNPDEANSPDQTEEYKAAMDGLKQVAPGIWIPENRALGQYIHGGAEVLASIGSAIVAEPISGLLGGVAAMLPGEAGQGADVVETTQAALTLEPQSDVGMEMMADLGSFLQPVGEFFGAVEEGAGGAVLEATGSPGLATAAHTLPTAMLEALGLGAFRRGSKLAREAAEAQERLKINPNMTPEDIAREATLPEARTYEQIATDLRNKNLADVAEDVRPDATIFRDGQELGVSLNPADYSTSEAFIRVQQALKSQPGSQMAAVEAENIAILGQRANELITEFGGELDRTITDVRVQGKMEGTIKELTDKSDDLYKRVADEIPTRAKSPMRAMNAYMTARMEQLGGDVSLLTRAERKMHRMLNADRPPPYGALDTLRRDIGDAYKRVGPFKDDAAGTLDQVYRALITDQSGMAKAFNVGEEFAAARKLVQTRKQVEKGAVDLFGREFAGSMVGKLTGAATAMTKGDLSQFKKMMNALPAEMRTSAAMTMLNDLFTQGARHKGDLGQGFAKAYEGLNRNAGAKRELFKYLPPEAQRRFDAIGNVSQGIFRARSLENTSKTARDILQVLESGGMVQTVYGYARPAAQLATLGVAQIGDLAAQAASKGATRAKRADALLSSNEFSRAVNKAMEGSVKEAEIMLKRSKVWQAFRGTLGEGTKAQLAAMGPIAWLTHQEPEEGAAQPPQPTDVMTEAPPAEGAGLPPVGPPPEVFPGVQ